MSGVIVAIVLPNDAFITSIASLACNAISIGAYVGLAINLSKKLHKDNGWVVLTVIFQGIMIPISGFSKKLQFDKDAAVDKNSYLEKYFKKQ